MQCLYSINGSRELYIYIYIYKLKECFVNSVLSPYILDKNITFLPVVSQ